MLEVLRCGHQSSLKAELDFELIQQQPQNNKYLKDPSTKNHQIKHIVIIKVSQ